MKNIVITKDNVINNITYDDDYIKKTIIDFINDNNINYVEEIEYLTNKSYLLVKTTGNKKMYLETPNNMYLQKMILSKYLFDRIKYTYSENIKQLVLLTSVNKTSFEINEDKIVINLCYSILENSICDFEKKYLKEMIEYMFTDFIDVKESITSYKGKKIQNGYKIEQGKTLYYNKVLFKYIKQIIDEINKREIEYKIKQLRMENV